ncbi:MAG: hypothetical protein HYU39_09765 [Thaumarchaeota archaeon]|nr:hypothetical protein [Nitrososphaerota archaeon]
MAPDFIRVAVDIVGLVVTLAIVYFSGKMMLLMRKGFFEKSWRSIATGNILVSIAVLTFLVRILLTPEESAMPDTLVYLGGTLAVAGALFVIWGLRTQILFWKMPRQ